MRHLAASELTEPLDELSIARDLGHADPKAWLRRVATRWMMLEDALVSLDVALQGLRVVLLKGAAVGLVDYPKRELRDLTDLDILVAPNELRPAVGRLKAKGWHDLEPQDAVARDYFQKEGYCRQLVRPGGLLLEIHYRLWGSLAEGTAQHVLTAAIPGPDRHLVPRASHRYLLSAVHGWSSERSSAETLWDLEWIMASLQTSTPEATAAFLAQVERDAVDWGVPLPVFAAARRAFGLFGTPAHEELAERLTPHLRLPERILLNLDPQVRYGNLGLQVARLLSGRPSRAGIRAIARRIWPHKHIARRNAPPGRAIWKHRWIRQAAQLRQGLRRRTR